MLLQLYRKYLFFTDFFTVLFSAKNFTSHVNRDLNILKDSSHKNVNTVILCSFDVNENLYMIPFFQWNKIRYVEKCLSVLCPYNGGQWGPILFGVKYCFFKICWLNYSFNACAVIIKFWFHLQKSK